MGRLDFTVKVLNVPSKVTVAELNTFFSYCGTVEKIQLHKNKDQLQWALVTFSQPYAYQTALLLNEASFAGHQIHITVPDLINETEKHKESTFIPAAKAEAATERVASKGEVGMMKKTKDDVENYKLSEKGKMVMDRTRSAVNYAGQRIERIGTAIKSNDFVANGAQWISDLLDKASKRVSTLANGNASNPNSRKQK